MYEQTLTFLVEGPEGRLDEITFDSRSGPILVDRSAGGGIGTTGMDRPPSGGIVPLSGVVGVLLKPAGDDSAFSPADYIAALPSDRRGAVVRHVIAARDRAKAERARLTAATPDNETKETNR